MGERDTSRADGDLGVGIWHLDRRRSGVEFHVPHFYGLHTVKGHFDRYEGFLDLTGSPVASLTVEADSLDSGNGKRDEHLRSADFFDVAANPLVRFEAEVAELDDSRLILHGRLRAAGKEVSVEVEATVTPVDDGFAIEAVALVDQRDLGMTWSPLGLVRAPSKLIVNGLLTRGRD